MGKQSQLELFQYQESEPRAPGRDKYIRRFFTFIRAHERLTSVVIVLIIVAVISYCLGVEKGKRAGTPLAHDTQQAVTQQVTSQGAGQADIARAIDKGLKPQENLVDNRRPEEASQEEPPAKYTIQVASFKTEKSAKVGFSF